LPEETQKLAHKAYILWRENPRHPSLQFKKVGKLWSIRIKDGYRALAHISGPKVYWIWIGHHAEYEQIISQNRS